MATILSAQCTDERVNKVTPGLFQKYPTPQDFAALSQPVLEEEIRSTGFFRNKAKNIIGMAKKLVTDFGAQVPRTMEEMLTLPGVARKTANVVLGTAYGIPTGVVVDTHVFRIAHRLKLSTQNTPEKVEQDLIKLVPPRALDILWPPGDLVWKEGLPGAQASVRGVPARVHLRLT